MKTQHSAFRGKSRQLLPVFARLVVLIMAVCLYFSPKAQTIPNRSQLQPINATGYRWQTGAFEKGIYLPQDTFPGADSGLLAIKNNILYQKGAHSWGPIAGAKPALKLADTLSLGGLRTPVILPDTATEPDYEIILVPDIQKMTETYPALLDQMFQWFKDSAAYYNTKAIIQLGDITNRGTVAQFVTASNAFKHIDSTGIPYAAVIGNHDYDSMVGVPANVVNRVVNNYNAYFGPSRYAGKPFYGGNYNGSNENFYINFDVGHTKYMVISLEFLPRDSSLAWAQRVLDSFPDRKTIIATHNYLSFYGEKSTDTTTYTTIAYGVTGNAGQAMWDKLIKKNPQITMVVCGHQIHKVLFIPIVQRITEAGLYGNVVNQILINYQDDANGGNGYMMRVKISPSTGMANLSVFSPTLQTIDSRFPPFALGYPETKVSPVIGIAAKYGGLYNAGETRLDSNVYINRLPLNRIVYTGRSGLLDTMPAQNPHKFLAGGKGSIDTVPYFRTIDTSDLPSGSGRYIQNLTPVPNTTTGMQTGNFHIKGIGVVGGPTGSYSILNGTPATFYVSHQSGNWGLSIQRAAGINTSGANLTFAHTYGADWSTPVPVGIGAEMGVISWFGTDSSLNLRRGLSQRGFVNKVGTNIITAAFDFRAADLAAGTERQVAIFGTEDNTGITFNNTLGGAGSILVGSDNGGRLKKTAASGGISKDADTVKLGQNVGQSGDPAALKQSREIPLNGNDLIFKNIGQGNVGYIKFYKDATKGIASPFIEFKDQRDTTLGQINFDSLQNTAIGKRVTQSLTTGAFNTLVGALAGVNITTGTSNTLIGSQAGQLITTGSRNAGIGGNTLFRLTTGFENVAVGASSFTNVTSGNDNIALGYTVGNHLTTGNFNIAMGGGGAVTSALDKNATGSRNIAMGISAAAEANVSTSNFNGVIALGFQSLGRGSLGDKNIGIGDSAAANVNVGLVNVILGANSLTTGTTIGDSNVIVSPGMTNSTLSSNNTVVGSNFHSTSSISNISIFGAGMTNNQSNVTRITRADQNMLIGYTGDQADNGERVQVNGAVRLTQLRSTGTGATIGAGTGAGTSPTIGVTGSDLAGTISITTGSSPATSSSIVTVTYNSAYASAPVVILTPGNAAAAALTGGNQVFVSTSGTGSFVVTSGSSALTGATAYVWYYHVIQ